MFLPAACTSRAIPEPVVEPEELIRAGEPPVYYLNVSIAVFDSQDLEDARLGRIYTPVREVEANYLPILLRDTLIETGFWGAVKVAPTTDIAAEVQVSATILTSTALDLALHVVVTDSRGATWLDDIYEGAASAEIYARDESGRMNPFQPLYNRIANDIHRAAMKLLPGEVTTIVRASLLRYAIALAPQAFSSYLEEDENGLVEVTRLPAVEDRMYLRVKRIRESEYNFTELMDEQYDRFFRQLQNVYPYWQRYSYELLTYNDRIAAKGSSSSSRKRPGTWEATEDVYRTFKEYKLNEDELRELADSFRNEAHPTVTELEGNVIELSGPLQDQYRKWRTILQRIYAEER